MAKKERMNKHPDWRLSWSEKNWYYVGDTARLFCTSLVGSYMTMFLMFQGINTASLATAILLVKIIDSVDDVLFGYIIDRIHIKEWKLFQRFAGEGKYERLTIGEYIYLPLGGHVVFEQFLLLFGEGVGQHISGFHKLIQRVGVLAVALEAALSGTHIAEVKIFQNQHLDTSSAVDELIQHDLFCPVPNAVHAPNPFHLIGGLELFGYVLLLCHLLGEQLHSFLASFVNLKKMRIQFSGQQQFPIE